MICSINNFQPNRKRLYQNFEQPFFIYVPGRREFYEVSLASHQIVKKLRKEIKGDLPTSY